MIYDIPAKAQACVLTGPDLFEIQEVTVPKPQAGEVLCRIDAVAICGSDPQIIRGELAGSWPPSYPFIAGHEWAGTIVAIGPGGIPFSIGDRVAGEAHKGCGNCVNCKNGRYTLCLNYGNTDSGHRHYGFTVNGAYAQYQVYSVRSVTKIPDNVSAPQASMCDTTGVALHGLELTGVTPGGTAVVIGPGPIGLSAMFLAKAMGCARVIVVGRGVRLLCAQKLGADDCVEINETDAVDAVRMLTNGRGADEVFECSGAKGTFQQAIRMVKKGGCVALLGVANDDVMEELPFKYITHNEISIFGSRANPNTSAKVLQMMSSGQLPVDKLISHTFALKDFAQALETFVTRKDNAVKVVILPNDTVASSSIK